MPCTPFLPKEGAPYLEDDTRVWFGVFRIALNALVLSQQMIEHHWIYFSEIRTVIFGVPRAALIVVAEKHAHSLFWTFVSVENIITASPILISKTAFVYVL